VQAVGAAVRDAREAPGEGRLVVLAALRPSNEEMRQTEIMMKSTAGWYLALGLMGAATMACGASGDIGEGFGGVDDKPDILGGSLDDGHELGNLESAITQTQVTYSNCSGANLTKAQAAVAIVHDLLYDPVESKRFLECMKNGTLSATGTYPEQQFHLLREPIPTKIVCDDPLDRGYAGHVPAPTDGSPNSLEEVYFGFYYQQVSPPPAPPVKKSAVANQTVNGLAELILHELVHTKGYYLLPRGNGHPGPEVTQAGLAPCADGCIERQMVAPIVAASCMFDDVTNNWNDLPPIADQIIPIRSQMAASTYEVTLAPVGHIRNTESGWENHCSTDLEGAGIRGRYYSYASGTFINALGMVCRDGSGNVHNNGRTGNTVGSTYSFTCPADEVLVGFSGRSGWLLDSLKPICNNRAMWEAQWPGHNSTVTPSSFGGSGGEAFTRMCPARHAVKGLRLRYADVITRMDVVCQRLGKPGNIQTVSLPAIGAPNAGSFIADEYCPSKSVMTKLWGVVGEQTKKLWRLGAGCSRVSNPAPGGALTLYDGTGNTNHMLPFGGRVFVPESGPADVGKPGMAIGDTAACPSGAAYVGLKTYTLPGDTSVYGVRGLCANVASWNGGDTSFAMGGRVGEDDYTTIQEQICPAKHFLTGWRMAEEPDVTNISLRCRQF
jgi:hypothetical protein